MGILPTHHLQNSQRPLRAAAGKSEYALVRESASPMTRACCAPPKARAHGNVFLTSRRTPSFFFFSPLFERVYYVYWHACCVHRALPRRETLVRLELCQCFVLLRLVTENFHPHVPYSVFYSALTFVREFLVFISLLSIGTGFPYVIVIAAIASIWATCSFFFSSALSQDV